MRMPALAQRLRERELSSDDRAGRFARAKARRLQREYLRRNWRLFTGVSLGMLTPLVTLPLLPNGFSRGLFVGVLVTTVIALLSFWVVQATGTAPIMMGDQGEQWTAQELRRLRRAGWKVVNDLRLKKWKNIDHVIVGPGGVYAIESKWSANAWDLDATDGPALAACQQVQESARTMSAWLKRLGVQAVQPVVVLWGANARDIPAVRHWAGEGQPVAVVAGPKAKAWLSDLPGDGLTDEQMERAWSLIDEQCRRRDQSDADDLRVPLSFGEMGMRAILTVLAGSASFLLAATWLETSPSVWLWLPALVVLVVPAVALWRLEARTRYLVWGWLAGVALTVVLLGWAIGKWFVDNKL